MSGFADVNGTRLYYEVAGRGDAVVLVHGLCLDTRMWDAQFDVLADRYRVVRYDVRGFGKSAVPTVEAFRHADDLRALLDYVDAPAAHVVGLSMGGRIALHHALLYPEATRSLVLVDSALDGFSWSDEWRASLDAIEERAHRDGASAGNQLWLKHELFAPARERPACAAQLAQIVGDCSGWNWVHESPTVGIDPPAAERLRDVLVPGARRRRRARSARFPGDRRQARGANTVRHQGDDAGCRPHEQHGRRPRLQRAATELLAGSIRKRLVYCSSHFWAVSSAG